MADSRELHLRLLRALATLCGLGALVFGVGHVAGACGWAWSFIDTRSTLSHVVMGVVMLGAALICSWLRSVAHREVSRRDWHRREQIARELGASAEEQLMEKLGSPSDGTQRPRHV